MGQALYRKYRSKSFSEVIGQKHITDTLQKAIKTGRISHAYLFTGPRGVGKTSVARILAHEVNELPYDDESIHLDIIEIDAASNRRIDEIRDLRDKVHITPTSAKYKVYIIDEVHMLTREAFNALLKTLEEPPAHVIFILATTEAHKLPETIISRTQRYNFKPMDVKTAADQLASIAKTEKIKIDREALELLAEFGDGSFRDSISLLDQLGSIGAEITADFVRERLGLPTETAINELLTAAESGNSALVIDLIASLKDQAIDAATIAKLIAEKVRQLIASGQGQPYYTELLRQLLQVGASTRPMDSLEIALLEVAASNSLAATTSKTVMTEAVVDETPEPAVEAEAEVEETEEISAEAVDLDESSWQQILTEVKTAAPALYTALRLAAPSLDGNALLLAFEFPLHQKKVESAKNKDIVGKAAETVLHQKLKIQCIIDKSAAKQRPALVEVVQSQQATEPGHIQTISNIFGSAEGLES